MMNRLPAGTVKRLHVDRQVMARNTAKGTFDPALTVQTSNGPLKAHAVRILGPSVLIQSRKPLSCGARAWVETHAEVEVEVEG